MYHNNKEYYSVIKMYYIKYINNNVYIIFFNYYKFSKLINIEI